MPEAKTSPRVTICLPTIGRLTYIEQTLESLARQTFSAYELIILYNGSDSSVLSKLESFAALHPDGRVLADSAAMPMFANFNRGLRVARGEYVAFFHDDDIYEPNYLERHVETLDANPSAAFAGSNYLVIDSENRVEGHRRLVKKTEIQAGRTFITELVKGGRAAIPTPGILFRRSAFGPEGWDEKLSMHFGDFVVYMRMAEKNDAALIAEPLMRLRLHGKNASSVPMSDAAPLQLKLIQDYIAELAQRRPGDPIIRELEKGAQNTYARHLFWGWLAAPDDAEAERCVNLLEHAGFHVLPRMLRVTAALGLRASRRTGLAAVVRRLGRFIR